jgi:hypothetical protein
MASSPAMESRAAFSSWKRAELRAARDGASVAVQDRNHDDWDSPLRALGRFRVMRETEGRGFETRMDS